MKTSKLFFILFFLTLYTACSQSERKLPRGFKDSCGYSVGQRLCDIELYDQYNNLRSVNSLSGQFKVIQLSAMWCEACQEATIESTKIKLQYETSLSYSVILLENYNGDDPSTSDLYEWASEFKTIYPVFQGNKDLFDETAENGFNIKRYPAFYVLDDSNRILISLYNLEEVTYYVKKKMNPTMPSQSTASSTSTSHTDTGCLPQEENE